MNKTFLASLHELHNMLAFIEEQVNEFGFRELQVAKILLAAEEALVNIISYGYPFTIGTIDIDCCRQEPRGIKLTMRDNGTPYNPLSNPLVHKYNPHETLEQRKIGGIGVLIILRVMDQVMYSRENNQNILTMIKYLDDTRTS